jgi:S1-C subfamily serine protease
LLNCDNPKTNVIILKLISAQQGIILEKTGLRKISVKKQKFESMKNKQLIVIIGAAIIGGLVAVMAYSALLDNREKSIVTQLKEPVSLVSLKAGLDSSTDFTFAAEKTVNAVVNVKTESTVEYKNPIYEFFYGDRYQGEPEPQVGIGSGVIITADGYIVTNNHVIENSDKISVTLNDKRDLKPRWWEPITPPTWPF